MEHWQDWKTGRPKELGDVWLLMKGQHRARCYLQGHPVGTEACVVVDDEVQRTEVFRDSKQMIEETSRWRQMFENKGWKDEGLR